MYRRKILKTEAKYALKFHRGQGALLTFLLILLFVCFTAAEWITGLFFDFTYYTDGAATPDNYFDNTLSFQLLPVCLLFFFLLMRYFVTAPLQLGSRYYYLRLVSNDPVPLSVAFSFYSSLKRIVKAFFFQINQLLRKWFLWIMLQFPAGLALFIYFGLSKFFSVPPQSVRIAVLAAFFLLFLTGQIFYFYFSLRYFLAAYLYVLYSCRIREAFRLSIQIMKSRKHFIFSLYLSYWPLYLSNLFIFPLFVTLPKIQAGLSCCAKSFMEQYERTKETASAPVSKFPRLSSEHHAAEYKTIELPSLKQASEKP